MDWLDTWMTAGMLAPSGDNLQPWAFGLDRSRGIIALGCDPARDPSPMNAGNTMARISLGAFLANVLYTHQHNSRPFPPMQIHTGGTIVVSDLPAAEPPGEIPPILRIRYTNRAPFGGELRGGDLARLAAEATRQFLAWTRCLGLSDAATAALRVELITEPAVIRAVAEVISRADRVLFGDDAARAAFLDAIRKAEQCGGADAPEGLPLETLALARTQTSLLRFCLKLPPRVLRYLLFPSSVAARTYRLVAGSPAVAAVIAPDWHPTTDVLIGMLVQLFWLILTREHVVAQPMMSLPVLHNMARHQLLPYAAVDELQARISQLIPGLNGERLGFLLRIGRATQAGHSPGRLPWKSLAYELTEAEGKRTDSETTLLCPENQPG